MNHKTHIERFEQHHSPIIVPALQAAENRKGAIKQGASERKEVSRWYQRFAQKR